MAFPSIINGVSTVVSGAVVPDNNQIYLQLGQNCKSGDLVRISGSFAIV